MKVAGEMTMKAPCDVVWSVLHDPSMLAQAIPGCERLEVTGPGVARLTVRLAIAAVGGSYSGHLTVTDRVAPERFVLKASASGDQGTAAADVAVQLEPAGGHATLVRYQASGVVSGPVAGVGTRLLASIAKRIADDLLAAVEHHVAGPAKVLAGAETFASPGAAASAGPAPAPVGPPGPGPGPAPAPAPAPAPSLFDAGMGAATAGMAGSDRDSEPASEHGYRASDGAATTADNAPASPGLVPARRRPRLAVAFGVGVALGLGGVIAAAILGRKGARRRRQAVG